MNMWLQTNNKPPKNESNMKRIQEVKFGAHADILLNTCGSDQHTRHAGLILNQPRRRWANTKPTFQWHIVFAGINEAPMW